MLLLVLLPQTVAAQDIWGARASGADSTTTDQESYWGTIPARTDSISGTFRERPRPTWENIAMTPYWVLGLPVRAAYLVGEESAKGLGKLGLFGGTAEYPGLKGPFNTYTTPSMSIHSTEGFTLGLNMMRPNFLKRDNLLFMRAKRSTKGAGGYGGGALFHLDRIWHLEVGGGFESVNQARFYGLGPQSRGGDLGYFYRSTSWGGFDLKRDVARNLQLGIRAYFSRIEVREPRFNVDQSLGRVHAGHIPFGYPGESNGWTVRVGLDHNSAEQKGRPGHGGYQSAGVSYFESTDGSELSFLTWHANLEKFFTLWHTDRTLAVRGFGNRIAIVNGSDVPFSRLVTFQRPDQLRGYSSLRFYGLGSVGLSVEYRWPIWVVRGRNDMGVDAYLFSDSGQVFDHTDEISLNNFRWTGGGGLRLINAARGMTLRFEMGFSEDDPAVRLTFSQTFQYNPRGFVYGKNPTKIR